MIFEKYSSWAKDKLLAQIDNMINWPRQLKTAFMVSADASCLIIASIIAFYLRLSDWDFFDHSLLIVIGFSLISLLTIFFTMDIYRSIARFSGGRSLGKMFKAVSIHILALSLFLFIAKIQNVPRTVAVIQPLVFLIMASSFRSFFRFILTDFAHILNSETVDRRVLIYGAGSAGMKLATLLANVPEIKLCGFIDDDNRLHKQRIDGVLVHHSSHLAGLVERCRPNEILLALPSIDRGRRAEIVRLLEQYEVKVQTLPNLANLVDGEMSVSDLREINVEDLLGREPVPPNELLLGRAITGKSVLVTGAGGSIGSELCRQILRSRPRKIILSEMNEHSLYLIDQELTAQLASEGLQDIEIIPEMGSILDRTAVSRLFRRYKPQTVFHAAAYKHVPLVEHNMISGMKNNIFGTYNLALEAKTEGVKHFILISTDKAVRPTNVMGASKRVCELILQALAIDSSDTKFAMVRFGNVLGSSGSVVPRFQKQIESGGPVTLTHKDITRYFMTIREAAQLVIQAGSMARGGEVFVLDMGKSVKIIDLARSMIKLSGLSELSPDNPGGDIEIQEVGLRPGEKLYEELLIGQNPKATSHPRIMQASEYFTKWDDLQPLLNSLFAYLTEGHAEDARDILQILVPEYQQPEHEQVARS